MENSDMASKCEAATGPDRTIDFDIAILVDWKWQGWEQGEASIRSQAERRGYDLVRASDFWDRNIPRYTRSIDAALTLVPKDAEDISFSALHQWPEGPFEASVMDWDGDEHTAEADTPALALCAAALRAQGTEARQGGDGLSGSVHDGPIGNADAPNPTPKEG